MTTTDETGRSYEVVQTFDAGGEEADGSSANHTAGFKSQRQGQLEAEGAPGPGLPLLVLALAGAFAFVAARRR